MDETRLKILNDSNKIISKLQLLSVFFGEEIIYKIYLRSQVIHRLFVSNEEIDINKLELYHLQFTASIIDLLKKIKKNNEDNVSLLFDEIQLNKELMDKMDDAVFTEQNFNLEKQRQALKINTSLRKLFQVLSDESSDYPFSKSINSFSLRFAQSFFYDIPFDKITELTQHNAADVYTNAYAAIQKKLMGLLCKYEFKNEFYCGFKSGELIIELYKFVDTDRYFLFMPSKNLFLFCDISKLSGLDLSNLLSKRTKIKEELSDKNDQLKNTVGIIKTTIPSEIKNLLNEAYRKISDLDFLQHLSNVDVQANILKAMLNTDSI